MEDKELNNTEGNGKKSGNHSSRNKKIAIILAVVLGLGLILIGIELFSVVFYSKTKADINSKVNEINDAYEDEQEDEDIGDGDISGYIGGTADTGKDSETYFADNLCTQINKTKGGENYVISPLSIKMAFAMAANGTDGETQDEILNTLGISDLESFNDYMEELIKSYKHDKEAKIKIANSVWRTSKSSGKISNKYKSVIEKKYLGKVGVANSTKEINNWISKNTNGLIDNVVDNLNFDTMIANALYFKGEFDSPFDSDFTHSGTFHCIDGKDRKTDFMSNTEYKPYFDDGTSVAVDLSMSSSDRYSFYVLKGVDNVEEFLKKNKDNFKSDTKVSLSLPKFKIEAKYELKDAAKDLGIKQAFEDGSADFSNMYTGDYKNGIDSVFHEAVIDVNESGVEAAAVTLMKSVGAAMEEIKSISFNKPFKFAIYDNKLDEVLFCGQYVTVE